MKLLFTGDVMFERSIKDRVKNGENPFIYVQDTFANHDHIVVNLETNISKPETGQPQAGKTYTFKSPLRSISLLKESGVDIVNLANNHTMDYGPEALVELLSILEDNNLKHYGAAINRKNSLKPLTIDTKEGKITFAGFNSMTLNFTKSKHDQPGTAVFNEGEIIETLEKARENCDLLIVCPHWGTEYAKDVSPLQNKYGRIFADCGADLVVGTHPHVRQSTNKIGNTEIHYSLGNFVFHSSSNLEEVKKGQMLGVEVKDGRITHTELIQITIDEKGFPHCQNS